MPTTNVARQPPSPFPTIALASTPPRMPGTHPPIFWLGGRQREYPPVLLRTLGYSRPILVALLYDATNSAQSGRQTVGSQGSSPQPRTRVDATGQVNTRTAHYRRKISYQDGGCFTYSAQRPASATHTSQTGTVNVERVDFRSNIISRN